MNLSIEVVLGRFTNQYLMLRYEDFVNSPREAVERMLKLAGAKTTELPFVTESEVALADSHMVAGNPSVYKRTGLVKIESDEAWRAHMKRRDKTVVTLLTLPLLLRYGYMSGVRG
jgi:hypothetical protein